MIQLSDEILNKYIDGELEQSVLNEVREQLKNSEEDRRILAALQQVHSELGKLKVYEPRFDFTARVMAHIRKSAVKARKDRYFIFSISTIFILICLALIGYVFVLSVSSGSGGTSTYSIDSYISSLTNFLESFINILSTKNVSIVGSIFSFGIIITGYIFFENLRHTKRKLGKLQ